MDPKSTNILHPERLKALADGVFAIVMTLLVLELAIPIVANHSNKELTIKLLEMWPKFISYILSFFVLGIYWIIHHKIFENIKSYDSTLAWLNIIFLMIVSLIPFTTSLLGEFFLYKTPTIIYGIQLLLMFLMGFSLFSYSTNNFRHIHDDYDIKAIKGAKLMGYIYFAILLIAIALAFFIPLVSICIYGLIVFLFALFSVISRDEYVMIVKI